MQSYEKTKNQYENKLNMKIVFTGTLPEDEPLLKVLGIDFSVIKKESLLVFDVFKKNEIYSSKTSYDLIGPLFYIAAYTFSLTLRAKLHFGPVYLLCICSALGIFGLLNLVGNNYIRLTVCCNVFGYCFLPILIFSVLNIFMLFLHLKIRFCFGVLMAFWAAYCASLVFCKNVGSNDKTLIVGYPLFVSYLSFVLFAIF
ncbi:hypothetical protein NUSPORA_02033 [Nucleospora cyclopteri]